MGGATPAAVAAGVGVLAAGCPAPDPAWLVAAGGVVAAVRFGVWWPSNFQAANAPASTSTTAAATPIHLAAWPGRGSPGGSGSMYGGPGWLYGGPGSLGRTGGSS